MAAPSVDLTPVANGELQLVAAEGAPEDFDQPADAGAVRWQGGEPIWIGEQLVQSLTAGGLDEATQTRVLVTAAVTVQRDDQITYQHGADTITRRVRDIQPLELLGLQRLHLWDS